MRTAKPFPQGQTDLGRAVLFLGTEKYPEEAEYKTYLSRNAGSSNAYTSRKSVSASQFAFC